MRWNLGMSVCFLSSSSLSLTSKAQEWGDRPGEGSPIVNLPFQMDRKGEGKKRKGGQWVPLHVQGKIYRLRKDRPLRADIDLRPSPQTTPN